VALVSQSIARAASRRGARTLAATLATLVALATVAQPIRPTDTEVKAAYVFNLARFVNWPADAFEAPQSPFVFAVLGDDIMLEVLRDVVRGKTVRGRPVVVEECQRARDLRAHVLFIGSRESFVLPRLLRELDDRPILTVADMEDFAERGGMVSFLLERQRVRFDVNNVQARHSGLEISSEVLKIARRVVPEDEP
jgi:hypothetical protein